MNLLLKPNFLKRSAPSSLLGLDWEEGRLEGVVLRRTNGSLQVLQRFTAPLSLDPLTNDVELVGREILNQLEAAGVRERRCVVAVPLKWALTAHTQLPDLPEADAASFLQIEAERGFPTDIATLQVATSRLTSRSGVRHALFVGVPRSHVERLELVLRAARLKPVSFSLGIAAVQPAGAQGSDGVLALALGENQIGLQITCGGGIAALRALEGVPEHEDDQHLAQSDRLAREARITLGQLPADLRELVQGIHIFGPREQAQRLADELRPRFEPGGLKVEAVSTYPAGEFGRTIPAETQVSTAFSLAARQLTGRGDSHEFLPPKISTWEQVTSRYASGKLRTAGLVAAGLVAIVLGAFLVQAWQLSRLRSRWSRMATEVRQLQSVQDQIQKYRPWFDDSFRYLGILKDLTQAFPEDGSVTAKTLEIRELAEDRGAPEAAGVNVVSCSGNAANYAALQKMVHQLGEIQGISDLNVPTRGKTPIQFSLDFHLNGLGRNEN
jgi:hypothetical protein